MKKIYLAGALNASACGYIKNMHKMIAAAIKIRRKGHSVFIPCLDFLVGLVAGDWEYQDYFDNSQPWLKVADEVWVLPDSENSTGTQMEIETAKQNNIPVVYLGVL